MYRQNQRPSDELMNTRMTPGRDLPPLPLLPEREWVTGRFKKIEYGYAMYQGKIQYVTNDEGEYVLDQNDQKIPRFQFKFIIELDNHTLPNGDPRKMFLRLGASLAKKANLSKMLKNLKVITDNGMTPAELIDILEGLRIKFQIGNKESEDGTKIYQNVLWDSIKQA